MKDVWSGNPDTDNQWAKDNTCRYCGLTHMFTCSVEILNISGGMPN